MHDPKVTAYGVVLNAKHNLYYVYMCLLTYQHTNTREPGDCIQILSQLLYLSPHALALRLNHNHKQMLCLTCDLH